MDFHPAAIGYQWNVTLRGAEGGRPYPAKLLPSSLTWWDDTLWIWFIIHLRNDESYLTQATHPNQIGSPSNVAEAWDGMDLGTVPVRTYWNDWNYEGLMAGWHVGPQTVGTDCWVPLPADRHPGGSPNILYADGSARSDARRRLTAGDIPRIAARAGGGTMHLVSWEDFDSTFGTIPHVVPKAEILTRWP